MSCRNEDKTGGSDNGNTGGEDSNGGDSNSGGENSGSVKTKHELEGTWVGYDKKDKNYELKFTVNSDGNITFYPRPYPHVVKLGVTNFIPYTYTGKVETNAIVYPYTVKISNRYIDIIDGEDKENRIFIFSNSSSCTAKYAKIGGGNDKYEIITTNEASIVKTNTVWESIGTISPEIVEFTKQ